jgi:ferrous iron transport protein B
MRKIEKSTPLKVGLVGNPNSGKSTVFNQLTGLRQKTGNFPGVTVEIKEGRFSLPKGRAVMLIDFPGAYSLYPTSSDEKVIADVLCNPDDPNFPDLLVYVADVTHLEKHLLLFTQLLDLQIPAILALNMSDVAAEEGIKVNTLPLSNRFQVPVVSISGRTGENIRQLTASIEQLSETKEEATKPFYKLSELEQSVAEAVQLNFNIANPYRALLWAHHYHWLPVLKKADRDILGAIADTKQFQSLRMQVEETMTRFDYFTPVVKEAIQHPPAFPVTVTDRLDAILTNRIAGPFIFFGVMLLVFMVIFYGYEVTGGWVEGMMGLIIDTTESILRPTGIDWLTDFVTKGILEGFKGVLVFVPQIAILSLLISLLEEVGYLSRAVFMFDRMMRRFGMNGRSIVALIGGGACAVPAIKGTRTIGNWKERIITIMVTPFISCSARIPVYMVLIPIALPTKNWQTWAFVFAMMYLLGIITALGSGWVMNKIMRTTERSFLTLEMPVYRAPHWKNVWHSVLDKVKNFVTGVWKPILIITSVLWFLSSFGPGNIEEKAQISAASDIENRKAPESLRGDLEASYKLEYSWAGKVGKTIEPAIRPLGYDWKIGIGILSSFLAREVFNSTMYIIYSLESVGKIEEGEAGDKKPFERYATLKEKMAADTFRGTDDKIYTTATGLSLLVFYALAMQCMSTLVVVKQETGRWRWAIGQFLVMGAMAYLFSWITYWVVMAV